MSIKTVRETPSIQGVQEIVDAYKRMNPDVARALDHYKKIRSAQIKNKSTKLYKVSSSTKLSSVYTTR